MTVIASGNGFTISSPQGRSVLEGSVGEGNQGLGGSYSISVNYSSSIYSYDTVWVRVEPANNNAYDDFWSYDTPLISGVPSGEDLSFVTTNDPNGIFGSISLNINADHFAEGNEVFRISILESPTGPVLFETNFSIIDDDIIRGTGNADILEGTLGYDWINGYGGADTLIGLTGNDNLYGNFGDDHLFGDVGNDTLSGGAGNDILDGGSGIDRLAGGIGNDIYVVDRFGDLIAELASQGTEFVRSSANYILSANVENLTLTGAAALVGTGNALANAINGNAGNNRLNGGAGNDLLKGGAGNDTLNGGAGNDTLDGGTGIDWVSFMGESRAGRVDLAVTGPQATWHGLDGIRNIENIHGGAGNDILLGNAQTNLIRGGSGADNIQGRRGYDLLEGGAGNDALNGGLGNDTLDGGAGMDQLLGGAGNDIFVFRNGSSRDVILDFQDNIDTIRILGFEVANFAQARSYATQNGPNLVFDFGDGDILTVRNTTINMLGDDLIFG